MITVVDYKGYNRKLTGTDWRYSCSGLGIMRFLDFCMENNLLESSNPKYLVEDDEDGLSALYYRDEDVALYFEEKIKTTNSKGEEVSKSKKVNNVETRKAFIKFLLQEYSFKRWDLAMEKSYNIIITPNIDEKKLQYAKKTFSDSLRKYKAFYDNYLKNTSIVTVTFSEKKYDNLIDFMKIGNNADTVFNEIRADEEHLAIGCKGCYTIISYIANKFFDSFKSYNNVGSYSADNNKCALSGYHMGGSPKEGAYCWDINSRTWVGHGDKEFEYIVFGMFNFNNYDSIFINNNFSFYQLKAIYNKLLLLTNDSINDRSYVNLVHLFMELSPMLTGSVEVIWRKFSHFSDKGIVYCSGFDSVYINNDVYNRLNKLKSRFDNTEIIQKLPFTIEYTDKTEIKVSREVFESILGGGNLWNVIQRMVSLQNKAKNKKWNESLVANLLYINNIMRRT